MNEAKKIEKKQAQEFWTQNKSYVDLDPRDKNHELHKKIKECKDAKDLLQIIPTKDELNKLDAKSLALIIERSGCYNQIAGYQVFAKMLEKTKSHIGDDEAGDRKVLLPTAIFVYTTPEYSSQAEARFGGKINPPPRDHN